MKQIFEPTGVFILGLFGSCPPCIDDETAPNYLCDPCDSIITSGGIKGWVAKKCNYEFTDITDPDEWETAIGNKTIFGRVNGNRILGEFPAAEVTTKTFGACGVEEVVRKKRTVSIIDNENDTELSINELYNFLARQTPGKWDIAFITCENHLIGFFSNVSIQTDRTIPQTKDDNSAWNATFGFDEQIGTFPELPLPFLGGLQFNVCCVETIVVSSLPDNRVDEGDTLQMLATITPTNATNLAVTWSVVNGTGTATIDPTTGLLTGVSVGIVTVFATAADGCGVVSAGYVVNVLA
jgi:hypothetical protein